MQFRSQAGKALINTFPSDVGFYDLPKMRTRTTSMGYGTKYDFTREHKNKCQVFYQLPTDFDPKKPKSPMYTFGLSRNYFEKVYMETNKSIDKNIPGPGKYDYLKPFGYYSNKFSIIGRETDTKLTHSNKYPGPGEYKPISINPLGKYAPSNIKNTTSIMFGLNKEKRFDYSSKLVYLTTLVKDNVPGPEKYDCKPLNDGKGFCFISKYKSSGASTIIGKGKDLTTKYTNYYSKYFKLL